MKNIVSLISVLALVLAACGGDDTGATDAPSSDDGAASSDSGNSDDSGSGAVVDAQPAGQAYVSVDGQEFNFDTPGLTDCTVEDDTFTFSFVIGDNEAGLAAGANLYEDGWLGNITLRLIDSEGLPVSYYPDPDALDGGIAIDGDSISYSGPILRQPPNDGSNPPPESIGEGTISATCG